MDGDRALGLRVKLGWAMGIVVTAGAGGTDANDDGGGPVMVVARDELRFGGGVSGYHAAMEADGLPEQAAIIARADERAADVATELLADAVDVHGIGAVGIIVGRGVRRIPLERILASSQLFHTAEAELLQDAFVEAADRLSLPCVRVPFATAEADESWSAIDRLGRVVGTPWRKDQKLAATAGWLALRECRHV